VHVIDFQSSSLAAQHRLLEKSTTRKAFETASKDSASLMVLRDTDSIFTSQTDTLSKISLMFDFDSELFASKVYSKTFRNSIKSSLRSRSQTWSSLVRPLLSEARLDAEESRLRSQEIDRLLVEDRLREISSMRVLVLGKHPQRFSKFRSNDSKESESLGRVHLVARLSSSISLWHSQTPDKIGSRLSLMT
jgi:hypothetical protein